MLYDLFTDLGIGNLRVLVNSLGGAESRTKYRELLLDYLRPLAPQLSETSQQRLEANPLRVLDSKAPQDRELLVNAPPTTAALSLADQEHWDELCRQLDALSIPYEVHSGLVRGLDYYTRTLFEIQSDAGNLGSQNALVGGGRYDGLLKSLGGPDVPGIGFAMGMERLLLAMGEQPKRTRRFCYIAPLGAEATREGLKLAAELRRQGFQAELDGRENSLKSKLRRANSMGASVCAIFGDAEVEQGTVQLKDLEQHSTRDVPRAGAASEIRSILSRDPADSRHSVGSV